MFTIGCDPEIFLRDKAGNPVSAYGLIEGTKAKPFPVADGAYQVDGLAVEFNTNPVAHTDFEGFNRNVVSVMQDLKAAVKKAGNLSFNVASVQEFPEEFLAAQPDEAKELGCDPDYSAYTLLPNPMPDGTRLFRTAAGHLHVGWGADIPVDNEEHIAICADFIKNLDATVGLLMTYIDREPRRRELYGKAGAFRPKPYGVEYRTPSNAWISHKTFRKAVFLTLSRAIMQMRSGTPPLQRLRTNTGKAITQDEIQSIIDTGDWKAARDLWDRWACADYGLARLAGALPATLKKEFGDGFEV